MATWADTIALGDNVDDDNNRVDVKEIVDDIIEDVAELTVSEKDEEQESKLIVSLVIDDLIKDVVEHEKFEFKESMVFHNSRVNTTKIDEAIGAARGGARRKSAKRGRRGAKNKQNHSYNNEEVQVSPNNADDNKEEMVTVIGHNKRGRGNLRGGSNRGGFNNGRGRFNSTIGACKGNNNDIDAELKHKEDWGNFQSRGHFNNWGRSRGRNVNGAINNNEVRDIDRWSDENEELDGNHDKCGEEKKSFKRARPRFLKVMGEGGSVSEIVRYSTIANSGRRIGARGASSRGRFNHRRWNSRQGALDKEGWRTGYSNTRGGSNTRGHNTRRGGSSSRSDYNSRDGNGNGRERQWSHSSNGDQNAGNTSGNNDGWWRRKFIKIEVRNTWTVRKTDDLSPEDYKQKLREGVWEFFKAAKLTKHHDGQCDGKIPYFVSCEVATRKLVETPEFHNAKVVKVNPSLAQHELRKEVIWKEKTLLMPRASLSSNSLFFMLNHHMIFNKQKVHYATCQKGIDAFAKPITPLDWRSCGPRFIDLYVVASVVVSTEGVRIGKGKGFADLEWAILHELGVVRDGRTLVVTTVHHEQIVSAETLPKSLMTATDVPVDMIVTPENVYRMRKRLKKPSCGVDFDRVTEEMLEAMPVLGELLEFRKRRTATREQFQSDINRRLSLNDQSVKDDNNSAASSASTNASSQERIGDVGKDVEDDNAIQAVEKKIDG